MFFKTSALLALAATVSSHIIMESPVPFAWENEGEKQFPLEPTDYPCKQPSGTYAVTTQNKYSAGGTIKVALKGGATHGGGTCQFSLTTDPKPSKESQFKVIKTIVGGCPNDAEGNASGSAETANPEIDVKLPDDLPAGDYTFAWSWQNRLGNREFYMNCSPITVGDGDSSNVTAAAADVSSVLGTLPDMFVVNLPATSCTNTAEEDTEPPNLGDNVQYGSQAKPGFHISGAGCASITAMGAGSGQLGSPAQATGAPAASSAEDTQPAASSIAGGVFAPGASSAPAATQPATTPVATVPATQPAATQPAETQPAAPTTTGASAPIGTGTPSNSSGDDCTPCDTDGAVVCIGSNQFGLCNRGCAVPQAIAAGMACTNGVMGAASRRSLRFPRQHLHVRHGSGLH